MQQAGRACYRSECFKLKSERFGLKSLRDFFILCQINIKSWIASFLSAIDITERKAFFLSPLPLGESAQRTDEGLKLKSAFTLAEVGAHVVTLHSSRKTAFTLAEVLITLGIIGVVAAMTMPTLIAQYQKDVTINKLKKAYSTMGQALAHSVAVNGDVINWQFDFSTREGVKYLDKYWSPYLQKARYCIDDDCGYRNMVYKYIDGSSMSMGMENDGGKTRGSFLLSDGTFIMIRFGSYGNPNSSDGIITLTEPIIYIDINSSAPPNKLGKDVFVAKIDNKNRFLPYCADNNAVTINNNCKRGNKGGDCCLTKIINDGWQMKDDYPW